MIKGIIFDLDGTVIDSMSVWNDVDRNFLLENGITSPSAEVSDKVRKMSVDQAAQFFIDELGIPHTKEYIIRRIEELVRIEYEENIQLKPYVTELLGMLDEKGIPYGVATATYKSLAEAVLKRCGIYDRFRFVLTDAEYPKGKKFPDIFIGGAERLGTEPAETLVIEDSLHCVETAVNAGFVTAAVYDEVSSRDSEKLRETADYYIGSLREAEQIINGGM